jgi:small subunit ribosomal protein S8|uniref:Small ribosomal subunit protein uS8c n=1 Tax=Mesostigma viride TaxID=41882 RepID=RR8_MESVI|nr:ribosomal protein S8 [Mesostigma viride]Q9MUU6.1 RecName: Full=Small ribosomal subunit protein uS8c; AltName: Full=30S ribosomal protein S8, chloroplastic [Mesostigma viride]AAF43805.1 ribosomal protein S8 [Mesostigma viride]WKT08254.1 ribosomal protein S8 [Mesostigma viride]
MVNDTIADMITRIRNANLITQKQVAVIASNTNKGIAQCLLKEGFIESIEYNTNSSNNPELILSLKYQGKKRKPYITALQRVSKSGLRVYTSYKDIPKVLGGIGIAILSTSQGILTDKQARMQKIGGEILCYIW